VAGVGATAAVGVEDAEISDCTAGLGGTSAGAGAGAAPAVGVNIGTSAGNDAGAVVGAIVAGAISITGSGGRFNDRVINDRLSCSELINESCGSGIVDGGSSDGVTSADDNDDDDVDAVEVVAEDEDIDAGENRYAEYGSLLL
jgi:hypothetical protein